MEKIYYDYKKLIFDLNSLVVENKYVFRGYSKQEQMLPTILRRRLQNKEFELINTFEKYALQYLSVTTSLDLVSYAQHFGLATRLLDFTYNPFIALFFSIYNKQENDEFYYLRYCDLSEQIKFSSLPLLHSIRSIGQGRISVAQEFKQSIKSLNTFGLESESEEYFDMIVTNAKIDLELTKDEKKAETSKIIQKFKDSKILFLDSNLSNMRLVMQQGLFMIPYKLDEEEHKKIIEENTVEIKICKTLRSDLLRYLNTIGVNTFKLMPDLSSVCQAVEREVKGGDE